MILIILLGLAACACICAIPSFDRKFSPQVALGIALVGLCFALSALFLAVWS